MGPLTEPPPALDSKVDDQIHLLRNLADRLAQGGAQLPEPLEEALARAFEDILDSDAVRRVHEEIARGELTIPIEEVAKELGIRL